MGFLGLFLGLTCLGARLPGHCRGALHLPIELPPLLFGPAELLHRRGEIKEVNGDDRGAGTEIGISDQCIQFPAGFNQASVDSPQTF